MPFVLTEKQREFLFSNPGCVAQYRVLCKGHGLQTGENYLKAAWIKMFPEPIPKPGSEKALELEGKILDTVRNGNGKKVNVQALILAAEDVCPCLPIAGLNTFINKMVIAGKLERHGRSYANSYSIPQKQLANAS